MVELRKTGGAQIGIANATWPLATLKVSADKIELKAGLIGSLVFSPADIITIEPYRSFRQGIRIVHRVKDYNKKVIFWTFENAQELIDAIKATGFSLNDPFSPDASNLEQIKSLQKSGSFPFKKIPVIALVVLWNLLILSDFLTHKSQKNELPIGFGSKAALAMVFLTGMFTLVIPKFRSFMLKPGRTVDDVRNSILFLLFITGVMFLGFSFAF